MLSIITNPHKTRDQQELVKSLKADLWAPIVMPMTAQEQQDHNAQIWNRIQTGRGIK